VIKTIKLVVQIAIIAAAYVWVWPRVQTHN